jgi:hypothetical protein
MTNFDGPPTPESRPPSGDPNSYDIVEAGRSPEYATERRQAVERAVGQNLTKAFETFSPAVKAGMFDKDTSFEDLTLKTPDVMGTHLPGKLNLARHTKLATGERVTTIIWATKQDPGDGVYWFYTEQPDEPGKLVPATRDSETGWLYPKTPPQDPSKLDLTSDYEVAFGAETLPDGIKKGYPGLGFLFRRKGN